MAVKACVFHGEVPLGKLAVVGKHLGIWVCIDYLWTWARNLRKLLEIITTLGYIKIFLGWLIGERTGRR